MRALEFWDATSYDEDKIPLRVYRRLLSRALWTLTWLGSPAGLEHGRRILSIEPQFAPTIGRYLAAASVSDQAAAAGELERLVVNPGLYLNAWQRLWLLDAAASLGPELPAGITEWALACTSESEPGILRARAAMTLSWYGVISADAAVRVFEQVPVASQPDAIAAIVNVAGANDPRTQAIAHESRINAWIVEWASGGG